VASARRPTLRAIPLLAVLALAGPGPAVADTAGDLQRANDLLAQGRYADAAAIAGAIARDRGLLLGADRAEAWRVYGLSLYFVGLLSEAESALLAYLKLDVDAHLDPALVPPEALAFFEDVRVRHRDELRAYRPRPAKKRVLALSLLPPLGQMQNGERTKGWILAGAGATLLAVHVGSFFWLRKLCDPATGLCEADGVDRSDRARALRDVNLASGAALVGLYFYGLVDGVLGHRRAQARDAAAASALTVGVVPVEAGATVLVVGRF
jgi:hypothetical protein